MKTTTIAALALSLFAFGAFAKNAPAQDPSTKSTVTRKSKSHKKSTASLKAPAAAVAPAAK
jgi:hypothetical protein